MKFDTPATTNPIDQLKVVGQPHDRIDGPLKTTGRAPYAYERHDVVANQAKVAALQNLYRHGDEPVGPTSSTVDSGRLFASPVANSDDGLGAPLTYQLDPLSARIIP